MDERKIIQMIDEYPTEPHSISNEWVQALLVCKDVLFELAGCKVTIEQLKMDVESLTNERDALQEMIIEQKAQMEKKDIEIDILIRKKEILRDEIAEQKAELESLQIRNKTLTDISQNYDWKFAKAKSKARKEFAKKVYRFLCHWRNWNILKTKWLFNGECEWLKQSIDNLLKEMEGE